MFSSMSQSQESRGFKQLMPGDESGGLYILMLVSFFPLYYWCFTDESTEDEFEISFVCHRPDDLEILQEETEFSKKELQFLYRAFKNECPSGVVTEDVFKLIYSQFFPQGDSSIYAHYLFEAFDTNMNGCLSFKEFVAGLSLILRGSIYDRLNWAFNFYDLDKDGFITREEMMKIMESIYNLMGKYVYPSIHNDTPREHVENFFQKMDRNRDGVITIEEFMESCQKMSDGFLMEVCVDSVESAINAERGGAARVELCCNLLEGGLTPSTGLLQVVKENVQIPVYAMIRPRGGDFLYSDWEAEVMKRDIEQMKIHRADGLVLGALTEDGRVDTELCMELLAASRPLPVTFHRAFDMVHDPAVALEALISLGFERILTSGCDSSALEGLPVLKRLVEQAKGRIVIMPGGGITDRNLQRILEASGSQEFHCSARSSKDSTMKFRNSNVSMGGSLSVPEYAVKVADVTKVRTLNAIAKNIL
ncbi:hypothetical protein G5714_013047 [Onychostoma macrolepis]|uniref:Copper homeostasis protein cutC homolog n=2 Tax=Onychostoma macrolepis TaxID=369639 RepID=A0A7J6CFK8_9TELE|nr:hypothetical protein G5714_013047 [Onychostoma macrolepis]